MKYWQAISWGVLDAYMDVSENSGTPKSSILNRVFHYKPSILGYPYCWKHPYGCFQADAHPHPKQTEGVKRPFVRI